MKLRLELDRGRYAVLLLTAVLVASCGLLGLTEPTETRYAEIAREMRASGDYLVPRLNGIAHFHKPPLAYWLTAAGFTLFGENEWGGRIPASLAAAATLGFLALAVRRRFASLTSANASLAVWMLGSSLLLLGPGRVVSCDPYLTASVTAFWAFAPSTGALAALGLGFLAKGPVVFVPTVLPILAVGLWERFERATPPCSVSGRSATALLGPAAGWVLFAAIALPWFLVMAARTPELTGYWLGNQTWERYTSGVHHRHGAWWYYIAILAAGFFPWTPALVPGFRALWRRRGEREARLLFAWLIVPLVFFSFSGSKLPAYLLPALPAAAGIATAGLCTPGLRPSWLTQRRVAWTSIGLLVVLAMGLLVASRIEGRLGIPRALAARLMAERAPGEPVVENRHFQAWLPFYLRETVYLLDVPRELQFDKGAVDLPNLDEPAVDALVARCGRVWICGPEAAGRALADRRGLIYELRARSRSQCLATLTLPAKSPGAAGSLTRVREPGSVGSDLPL